MALEFSQSTLHLWRSHVAIFVWPMSLLSLSWNVKALPVLQWEHWILARTPSLPALQPWAPLFAIRGCLLLAALAQWLCGRFWTSSKHIVVQAGGSFPPDMWLQLKEGKSLVSEGHCHCVRSQRSHRADASQIGLIFQCMNRGSREGNLSEEYVHTCFKTPDYMFVYPFLSP